MKYYKILNEIIKYFIGSFLIIISLSLFSCKNNVVLGTGASFPAPVYKSWCYYYYQKEGKSVNYQSIGSGGGLKNIKSNVGDFAASDIPMTKKELDNFHLKQIPFVSSGIVVATNIPGIKDLKLSNKILSNIFLGKIKFWDNKNIKNLNPNKLLKHENIIVIHRCDGSGTTWNFTKYLCKISKTWNNKIGFEKIVDWPVGIGAKGNEGVSNYIKQTKNSIGYLDYVDAKNLSLIILYSQNKYIKPNFQNIRNNSWPIVITSYIIFHKNKNQNVKDFLNWCAKNYKIANDLGYVILLKKEL